MALERVSCHVLPVAPMYSALMSTAVKPKGKRGLTALYRSGGVVSKIA